MQLSIFFMTVALIRRIQVNWPVVFKKLQFLVIQTKYVEQLDEINLVLVFSSLVAMSNEISWFILLSHLRLFIDIIRRRNPRPAGSQFPFVI